MRARVAVPALAAAVSVAVAGSQGSAGFDAVRRGLVHVGQATERGGTDLEQWLGSGFLVDAACTVATAKHLFDLADRERLLIRHQVPGDPARVRTVPARVFWEDPERDVAYVRLTPPEGTGCDPGDLRPLGLIPRFEGATLGGESVRIAGFPRLGPYDVDVPIVRAGIVASAEGTDSSGRPVLLLDLAGVPGFSGSPVVLERTGQVIGIVYGPGLIERTAAFEFATPLDGVGYARDMEAAAAASSAAPRRRPGEP